MPLAYKNEKEGTYMTQPSSKSPRTDVLSTPPSLECLAPKSIALDPSRFARLSEEKKFLIVLHYWIHEQMHSMKQYLLRWENVIDLHEEKHRSIIGDTTNMTETLPLPLAKLTFIANVDGNVDAFMTEFNNAFSSADAISFSEELDDGLTWYLRVMLLIHLGDYKWYSSQHDESHALFVKAMNHLPKHDDEIKRTPRQESTTTSTVKLEPRTAVSSPHDQENFDSISWENIERELVEFLAGFLHLRLGMLTHYLDNVTLDDALAHLQHAMEISQRFNHRTLTIRSLLEVAFIYYNGHDLEKTWSVLEQADVFLQDPTFQDLEKETKLFARLRALHDLMKAQILYRQGRLEESFTIATHLYTYLRDHHPLEEDPTILWKLLFLLTAIHIHQSSAKEVMNTLTTLLQHIHSLNLLEPTLRCFTNIIQACIYQSNMTTASEYLHEMDKYLISHDITPHEQRVVSEIPQSPDENTLTPMMQLRLEWIKGYLALEGYQDPMRALVHLQRALLISEDHDQPLKTASLLTLMTLALLNLEHLEEAEKYLIRLDSLLQKLEEDDRDLSRTWIKSNDLFTDTTLIKGQRHLLHGILASKLQDLSTAQNWLEKSLITWGSEPTLPLPHRYWKAKTILTYVEIFRQKLSSTKLKGLLQEGLETSRSIPNSLLEANFMLLWADVLLENYLEVDLDGRVKRKRTRLQDNKETEKHFTRQVTRAIEQLQTAKEILKQQLASDHTNKNAQRILYQVIDLLATAFELKGLHEIAAATWDEAWELHQEMHGDESLRSVMDDENQRDAYRPSSFDELWWS